MSPEGGAKKKFYLLGSDYVYPRTTNKILRIYLNKVKKVPDSAIAEEYTPFHHQDYQTIVGKVKSFAAAGDAAVINTINGDSNVPFFKELANQGVTADSCPVMSFSFAEVELQTLDVKPLVGHLASWNYFMSLKTPENIKWVKAYKDFAKKKGIAEKQAVTDDPMMHGYIHVKLWAKAAQKAESTEVDKVLKAVEGLDIMSPVGKYKVDEKNHHTWKPVYIGKISEDGQFDVVWRSKGWVAPEPWSGSDLSRPSVRLVQGRQGHVRHRRRQARVVVGKVLSSLALLALLGVGAGVARAASAAADLRRPGHASGRPRPAARGHPGAGGTRRSGSGASPARPQGRGALSGPGPTPDARRRRQRSRRARSSGARRAGSTR